MINKFRWFPLQQRGKTTYLLYQQPRSRLSSVHSWTGTCTSLLQTSPLAVQSDRATLWRWTDQITDKPIRRWTDIIFIFSRWTIRLVFLYKRYNIVCRKYIWKCIQKLAEDSKKLLMLTRDVVSGCLFKLGVREFLVLDDLVLEDPLDGSFQVCILNAERAGWYHFRLLERVVSCRGETFCGKQGHHTLAWLQ